MFFKFDRYTQGSFGPQFRNKFPVMTKAAAASFGTNYNLNRFNTNTDDLTADSVLEEWLPKSPQMMNRLYRNIHKFDSVAGPAVDLISIMPFSDVTLVGVDDPEILKIYEQTMAELHIETLLPEIANEYLVIGRVIGSLLFDKTKGIWTDIIIQDPDYCEVTNIPLRGHDPKVDLKISNEFREFLKSKDPRDEYAKKDIPPELMKHLDSSDILPLDPISTLYLPRKTYPADYCGSSIYCRILPFYALEKTLINGTLIGAKRRQRSILHVTVGETDVWEPDDSDISTIAGMFMQADEDPVGAIVATRNGVTSEEIRCLEGNTLISTDKGLIKIQEIIPNYKSIKDPVSLPIDIKVKGLDGTYVKADKWQYQGIKPTFNYYTNSGYKINCTENHKFLTLGELASLDLVRVGDINNYICVENIKSNTIDEQLPLTINIPKNINMNRKASYSITIPKYMTPELAYLFGITISEGWIGASSIEIGNTDIDILEKANICLKKVFNKTSNIRESRPEGVSTIKGKTYKTKRAFVLVICSKLIINIFNQLGVLSTDYIRAKNNENSPSYYKEVPWSILQADRQSKLAFLAAYIDGDGSIIEASNETHKAVELCFNSTSKKILNSIKVLLSSMGYYSKLQGTAVSVSTSNGSRLYNELFPYLSCERKKKHKVCGSPRNRSCGIPSDIFVPVLESRQVKRLKKGTLFKNDNGDTVFIEGGWKYLFRHYIHSKSYLSYDCYRDGKYKKELDVIKQVSNKLYNNLINLFGLEYKFEKIIKCTEGKEVPCYDISIEETSPPVFVANGILVKNSGQDFWKISDEWDFLSTAKMRALGIGEAFLSGDATYSNMETSLSVFVEMLRDFRENLVSKIFYETLFPTLAKIHGFRKRTQAELAHGIRINGNTADSSLIIPQITFHKQLRPEADTNYLDVLTTMEEKGIPIPLRTWASAGGLKLERIFDMKDEDVKNRKYVKEWKDEMKDTGEEGEGEDEEGEGTWGSVKIASLIKKSLDTLPIWIHNKFLDIRKDTMITIIKSDHPKNKLMSKFKNDPRKLELANYILRRMGINDLPFNVSVCKEISAHLKKCSSLFSKQKVKNEFILLNRMLKETKINKAEVIDYAKELDVSKNVSPVKNLYSGVN